MNLLVGYLVGMHIGMSGLNEHHPILEVNDSVMVYENSFERASVAVFKKFEWGNYKFRAGLTSGYKSEMEFRGRRYKIPTATEDGIGLFLAPSFEQENFVFAIMGNSINTGVIFKF